jgi:hypothetical protein
LSPSRLSAAVFLFAACASFSDEWDRAVDHYEAGRYRPAVQKFNDLEPEIPRKSVAVRTQFYFYRGMSNLRAGKRRDARHDLAVADELRDQDSTALTELEKEDLDHALQELGLGRGAGMTPSP